MPTVVSRSTLEALLPLWIYLIIVIFVFDVVLLQRNDTLASVLGLLTLAALVSGVLVLVYLKPSDDYSRLEGKLYSGHCGHCRRILLDSPLMRGVDDGCEEVYAFDSRSSSCQLCRFLVNSLQATPVAYLDPTESSAISTVGARSYGTIENGAAERGHPTPILRIFRKNRRTSDTYLQMHTPGNSSPVFQVFSVKGNCGLDPGAYQDSVANTTGSDQVVKLVAQWITSCVRSHPECRQVTYCPKRLIHILSTEEAVLIQPDITQWPNHYYAALSHCWGPGGVPKRLTRDTEHSLSTPFSVSELPPNFRDAVLFAFRLGIRYIWIDSLCILQDSAEDWEAQSGAMSDIYAGAVCTIAATASVDFQGGCFRRRVDRCVLLESHKAYKFLVAKNPLEGSSLGYVFAQKVEISPWNDRAWTYQERLLSRRIVHFAEDVVLFECNSMRASERLPFGEPYQRNEYIRHDGRLYQGEELEVIRTNYPELISWPYKRKPRVMRSGRREGVAGTGLVRNPLWLKTHGKKEQLISQSARSGIRGALDMLQSLSADLTLPEKIECHCRWYELLWKYTGRKLTFQSDKLVALAGLINLISAKSGRRNVAGLWESTLALDLLWVPLVAQTSKADVSVAPTWSWAFVDGPVRSLLNSYPDIAYYRLNDLEEDDGRRIIAEATIERSEIRETRSLATAKDVRFRLTGPLKTATRYELPAKLDSHSHALQDWEASELVTCVLMFKRPLADSTVDYAGLMVKHKRVSESGIDIFERVGIINLNRANEPLATDGWETRTFFLE